MACLATFYTHHDATMFFSFLKGEGIPAKMAPVPRKLSSSCGVCVRYTSDMVIDFDRYEIEAIHTEVDGNYAKIWENDVD